MAKYECIACGSIKECSAHNKEYVHYGWEFWCFGNESFHSCSLTAIRLMKAGFRPTKDNHPPMLMKCIDENGLLYMKNKGE